METAGGGLGGSGDGGGGGLGGGDGHAGKAPSLGWCGIGTAPQRPLLASKLRKRKSSLSDARERGSGAHAQGVQHNQAAEA